MSPIRQLLSTHFAYTGAVKSTPVSLKYALQAHLLFQKHQTRAIISFQFSYFSCKMNNL
jgi:hypothetical protein